MFGWLKRARPGVFRYYDGSRWRNGDPVRLQAAIEEHGGDNWPSLIGGLDKLDDPPEKFQLTAAIVAERNRTAMQAVKGSAELARKVFGVKQVDDNGLTDAECVRLFGDYLLYAARIQRDYRPFRKPLPDTASPAGG
jgi:hypothetical protein